MDANVTPKFNDMNGVGGIVASLGSNVKSGLPENRIESAREFGGENRLPSKPPATIWELMWEMLHDPTLIVLCISSVISLVIGVTLECPATGWIEGFAIMVAVLVVLLVGAINDYKKEQQFRSLNAVKDNVMIDVVRNGTQQQISTFDVVVGDVVEVSAGDVVCADGILVQGSDVKVNESSLTGEPDDVKKGDYEFRGGHVKAAPILFGGTKVMEGTGRFVVIAVGTNSYAGRTAALLNEDDGETSPLQAKLNKMALFIGKAGLAMAGITGFVLLMRFAANFGQKAEGYADGWVASKHWSELLKRLLLYPITVLVVAVPEGLPLAVTITLAYSVKKMMKDNNLVRHLDACETMGSATTVLSDKTGTLTTNRMTVVRGYFGDDLCYEVADLGKSMPSSVKDLVASGIAFNSDPKSRVEKAKKAGAPDEQVGNKTECALLQMVTGMGDSYESRRQGLTQDQRDGMRVLTFSSDRKRMTTVVPRGDGSGLADVHCKGASEMVLELCDNRMLKDGNNQPLASADREEIRKGVIEAFARAALRTIAVAHKTMRDADVATATPEELESGLSLMIIVGIEDPVRDEVPRAIQQCAEAGITVRMVTGDNPVTARAIAEKCGILKEDAPESACMIGPEFRARVLDEDGNLKQDEVDKIWPGLAVLARSSPHDKHTLVSGVKASKARDPQVVAVTGDGTNDGPALKKADVGFAMGITGTVVAQEASDIILMDDNFASIVKACMWGRSVYDNICRFLQFQLTVNLVAILVAFLGSASVGSTVFTAVQLLWINMIMDSLASLALATEPPNLEMLKRKPIKRDQPLLSATMLRNMIFHALWQIAVVFFILFAGQEVFHENCDSVSVCSETQQVVGGVDLNTIGCPHGTGPWSGKSWNMTGPGRWDTAKTALSSHDCFLRCGTPACVNSRETYNAGGSFTEEHDPCVHKTSQHFTMIFYTFVLMTLFNEINARKIHNESNMFEGILKVPIFQSVVVITLVIQIAIAYIPGLNTAINSESLYVDKVFVCIIFGLSSIPAQYVINHIPPTLITLIKSRFVKEGVPDVEAGDDAGASSDDLVRGSFRANASARRARRVSFGSESTVTVAEHDRV